MRALYPYQQEGAAFLASRMSALLADTPGLGKSAQAVAGAAKVGARSVLVICPASLVENWKREFAMWWPEGKSAPALDVVSYDRASRNVPAYLKPYDLVVLDESHYLKSPTAKRTKAVYGPKMNRIGGIVEKARRVWNLTGTPAPNSSAELWPMLHCLNPGAIIPPGEKNYGPMNYWQFVRRFNVVRNNGFGDVIVRGRNLDELKRRMAPFVLRRRKEEVLKDLPEIRFGELALSGEHAKKLLADLEHEDVTKLRKALAEGPEALSKLSAEMATVRRLTALAKAPAVAEWAKEWLEGCSDKLVIFAQHRGALLALGRALSEHSPAVIRGGVAPGARQEAVDRFQNDPACRVFIGQIQAAGPGITLTAASDLIFLEQSWTPAENAQAAMRIHRIGQKRGCLVRVAVLAGSIDEAVQRVLARKTEDIVQLFGAVV